MEVSGRRNKMCSDDHTTGILCDPCLGVNEEENAIFYCTVCNEFLCDADAKAHRKAGISKAHQLLDRHSMPRQKIGSYEDNICPIHKGEILKYYCNSHSKSVCSVCASKEHKQCKIECIDDIAKGYEKSTEYKSLMRDMTDLMCRLQNVKQKSLDLKSNAKRHHSEIVSEIRKFREEINGILDLLENASLKEAIDALHVESGSAESTTTNCDTLMAELQEITSSIENLKQYKQEIQLVLHSKNARVQVNHIKDVFSELADLNIRKQRKDCKFITNKMILKNLRSLKGLGRVDVNEESTKPDGNDQKARKDHYAEAMVPVANQPVTVSHFRDINIQHSTDTKTRCLITGGVMVENNQLVLLYRDNHSVKLVDVIKNNVTSCIKLPSEPCDITRVEQEQVVVSCDWGILVFLKVGKTLNIVTKLVLNATPRGIAYKNNSFIVGFGFPDHCVKVIDMRGETLNTFKTDASGNNLFKDPMYIALSEDQNTMFVSDSDNARITSLRMDGTVQGVYTDCSLSNPRGLTVDKNGNVYVAGRASHNIPQLSTDCKPIRVILDSTHGIKCPSMLSYCKTEHKLYIGYESWRKSNHVSVFQLQ